MYQLSYKYAKKGQKMTIAPLTLRPSVSRIALVDPTSPTPLTKDVWTSPPALPPGLGSEIGNFADAACLLDSTGMMDVNHPSIRRSSPSAPLQIAAVAALLGLCALVGGCAPEDGSGTDRHTPDVSFDTPQGDTPADTIDEQVDDTGDDSSEDTEPDGDVSDTDTDELDADTAPDVPDIDGCDESRVGEPCGDGMCGAYVCDGDRLVCSGDLTNPCGGCGELSHELGEACAFGDEPGQYLCDTEIGDATCQFCATCNLCGGEGILVNNPGSRCGDCGDGVWQCDGPDAVNCDGPTPLDACGGCGGVAGEPGDSCGACDDGIVACVGTEARCVEATAGNACGGCSELDGDVGDDCSDECGAGALACSEDGESLRCIGEATGNGCGGCDPLIGGEQPGSACSDCGVWECLSDSETACSDPRSFNPCGGCVFLEGIPGETCGCGGAWECDGENAVVCVGGDPPNECGGCDDLSGFRPVGSRCEECGRMQCTDENTISCVDNGVNECGSCLTMPLGWELGEDCGCGGAWTCLGGVPSCTDEFVNACGGCGFLETPEPGTECGTCGLFTCDGGTETVCIEGEANICGGCAELDEAGTPGESCEDECHVWACLDPDRLECVPEGANACGTCAELEAQPGFDCGDCGTWVCTDDGEAVDCEDPGLNECGSCGDVGVTLGDGCGPCEGNVWACDGEGGVECLGTPVNECGGCEPLPEGQHVFDPCEHCGQYLCDARDIEGNSTICIPGIVYACDSCEPPELFSDLEEGDACVACDETGAIECTEEGPQCSVADRFNACLGCEDLRGEPGDACGVCGVWSCTSAETVTCIDPCL